MPKRFLAILIFLLSLTGQAQTSLAIKGVVTEPDSTSPMAFVYVINQNSGQGQMSDFNGKFVIGADEKDTIVFSFVGYYKLKIPAKDLTTANGSGIKVVMKQTVYNLNQVTVSDFKFKPYEKDYMKRVIEQSHMPLVTSLNSPITALYNQFSRKGKEQRKLAQIFEEIFEKEQVEKKFNAQILRKLTGDDYIDFEAFRKYCFYLSNDYILSHDGYDLYYKVMDCYYRWKDEGH